MKLDSGSYDYSNAQRGSFLAPVLPSSGLRQSTNGLNENSGPSVILNIGDRLPPNLPMTMNCSVQPIESVEVGPSICQRISECMAFCLCCPKKEHVD